MVEQEFFKGPYRILSGVSSLVQKRMPGRGEIILHESGAIVLRCPKCAALQFTRADVLNSPDTPTLDRPVHCGSGHCKKCGIWFVIRNGIATIIDEPAPKVREIPKALARAGVRRAPKIEEK